ncbi:MAG: prolyl oligopeptidase family serine peptidase [Lachnospiraceae bacterium]|nr:prolyl oligopeptidase family serine peptidase [Lachnospiraceae bacterium]
MKKTFKNLFSFASLALALVLTLGLFGLDLKAFAAEGTVYEAEDATIEGTPSQEGAAFVEEHESASGGKNVGFFGVVGNKVTWTVEHEGGEVTLDFVLASGAFSFETFGNGPMQLKSAVKLYLNDAELDFEDVTLEGNANYDNWTEVFVPATLVAGTNKIALEIIEQPGSMMVVSPNIDCLKVCAPGIGGGAQGGQGGQSQPAGNTEVKVYEAEDAKIEGTPSQEGANFVEDHESASGGKNVGFLSNVGNKITWTFEHEGGDATLDFVLASAAFSFETFGNGPMQLKGTVKITLNGEELNFNDITLEGNENYDNWTDVYVPATLKAGTNTVTLEVIEQPGAMMTLSPNVDCLKVGGPDMANGSQGGQGAGNDGPVEVYEAEDAKIEGSPSSEGASFIEEPETASGGKSIGYFGVAGNKITWTFEHKGGAATLDFVLASGVLDWTIFANGDMQLKGNVKFYLNGEELAFNDVTLKGTGTFSFDNWTDVYVPATLKAGTNTVTLEIVQNGDQVVAPNIDCLKVGGPNMAGGGSNGGGGVQIVEKEVIVEKIVKENKYVNVPTPIVKTTEQNLKDVALFAGIICAILFVCYAVYGLIKRASMTEEDKKAFDKVKAEKKALKNEFKESYAKVSGAEEREIARYEYKLKRREAKERAYKELESLNYGEGKSRAKALDTAYGKNVPKFVAGILVASCILGTIIGLSYTGNVVSESVAPVTATSTLVVTGYDWGPGANKIVLNLPGEVKAGDVSDDMFKVSVAKQGFMAAMGDTVADRKVVAVYISDEQGNKVNGKSKYVTIEMEVDPAKDETSPFHYDFMDTQRNTWADPYTHTITLDNGKKLQIGKTVYSKLECKKQSKTICPDLNDVTESVVTYDGQELRYASYAPEKLSKDNVKNALIIWLHGMGEGGKDIRINTLGNKVSALWKEDIQKCFDGNGAYVLAPQSPTMWMDNGTGELTMGNTDSMYQEALWQLITKYVESNPDIDPNRILIGGCSNGGYMTMNMIILHPDYFAAAYPCCEAFGDENITDAQLQAIKNIPMWFTHAKNDTTVVPEGFTVATYNRLVAAGAKEVHFTFWDDVRDTTGLYKNEDGTAYSYMGHYSWIYLLNNENTKDFNGSNVQLNGKDVTVWQWLAAQKK